MSPIEGGNRWINRAKEAGIAAALLGYVGVIVSGISFIASGSGLSDQETQRLVTQVNAFDAVFKSAIIAGAGAAVALGADKIEK